MIFSFELLIDELDLLRVGGAFLFALIGVA